MIANTTADLKVTEQSLKELATQSIIYRSLATLGIAASTFGHETLGSIEGVDFAVTEAIAELADATPDLESVLEKDLKRHSNSPREFLRGENSLLVELSETSVGEKLVTSKRS